MSVQRIAGRYAKSLLDLAREQNKLDRVLEDVKSFQAASKNRDFYLLLKSPIVNSRKKLSILDALFLDKYDEMTMAFLRILVNKGREPYLPEVAEEFIAQYKKIKHISTIKVTTAQPMSAAALDALKAKLTASDATAKSVEIETAVNPELIGGLVLELDDKIYDASVAQKLEEVKRSLLA
ncbi:ATP synthase F1 subunit delta [Lewinella cohaerens]|uniref:ATP synthase F1 subunit delta n=1 Tax=Lewinella cohaerens TaxID=70995 RepID=UPI00037821B4|nr:ATP synthase F1 subunit delta [Lewinella cohaerens]